MRLPGASKRAGRDADARARILVVRAADVDMQSPHADARAIGFSERAQAHSTCAIGAAARVKDADAGASDEDARL